MSFDKCINLGNRNLSHDTDKVSRALLQSTLLCPPSSVGESWSVLMH